MHQDQETDRPMGFRGLFSGELYFFYFTAIVIAFNSLFW